MVGILSLVECDMLARHTVRLNSRYSLIEVHDIAHIIRLWAFTASRGVLCIVMPGSGAVILVLLGLEVRIVVLDTGAAHRFAVRKLKRFRDEFDMSRVGLILEASRVNPDDAIQNSQFTFTTNAQPPSQFELNTLCHLRLHPS